MKIPYIYHMWFRDRKIIELTKLNRDNNEKIVKQIRFFNIIEGDIKKLFTQTSFLYDICNDITSWNMIEKLNLETNENSINVYNYTNDEKGIQIASFFDKFFDMNGKITIEDFSKRIQRLRDCEIEGKSYAESLTHSDLIFSATEILKRITPEYILPLFNRNVDIAQVDCVIETPNETENNTEMESVVETPNETENITENKRNEILFFDKLEPFIQSYNYKLKRQVTFGNYRLDGWIPEIQLAIEYDEKQHKYSRTKDKFRELKIRNYNKDIEFVRLNDDESIESNICKVIEMITMLKILK